MKNKTLFISDLDGTLLNSRAELSDYTIEVLNRILSKEIPFSLATARTSATTMKLFEKVNLNMPIILMNGVLVYDPRSQGYIKRELISQPIKARLIEAMREANQDGILYTFRDGKVATYYEKLDSGTLREFVDERVVKYNKVFSQVADFSDVGEDSIYFCFLDEQEKIERIDSLIAGIDGIDIAKYRDIYEDHLWYLEVFSVTASKYNGVQFLREQFGFEKIVCFGDNLNDIPMFLACDECYAMANARDEVKALATDIIGSNDEDGVAKWLEGHLL